MDPRDASASKKSHVGQKLKCPECDFAKSPIFKVKDHLYTQFFCDQCPFISRSKDAIDCPGRRSLGDLCTECTVQPKKALERHKKLDHPVPGQEAKHLVCTEDECSYTFENYEMKRHIRGQHEGLKP